MADYELWLTSDEGVRIALLDDFLFITYSRLLNDVGWMSLNLPASFDTRLLVPDRQIQVWRAPTGGRLSLWRPYFIRKWRFSTIGSDESVLVWGPDCNGLLDTRIVAYFAGEDESRKTALEADDMMKEIVDENLGSGVTDTDRDLSAHFAIQADSTDGPQLTKRFAWRNVLSTLRNISDAAREEGTEVWFDVVASNVSGTSITFEFRTYTGQPGQDRTRGNNQTVFDQDRGNMRDPFVEYDYSSERTYVYSLGQGELSNRRKQEIPAPARIGTSFWNRREAYMDARFETTDVGVQDAGRAKLIEGRPRIRFGAEATDTEGTRFGRDWDFGDKVIARYRGQEFEPLIEAVQISVRGENETVRARLELEN